MAVVDAVDPIQGICYAPLPCLTNCHASMDIGQSGYENLWASSGRDDLGIMARMGAKSLRVYHPTHQPDPMHHFWMLFEVRVCRCLPLSTNTSRAQRTIATTRGTPRLRMGWPKGSRRVESGTPPFGP